MTGLAWEAVRDAFAFDGGLRDIYVFRTEMADWQRTLRAIPAAGYKVAYFRNDQPTEIPADASQAFPQPGECDRRLSVWVAGLQVNCHFFTVDEIEFDIDPREVKGQPEFDALIGFMRLLADAADKEAVLTAENAQEMEIFRVRPGQAAIEYRPFLGKDGLGGH